MHADGIHVHSCLLFYLQELSYESSLSIYLIKGKEISKALFSHKEE